MKPNEIDFDQEQAWWEGKAQREEDDLADEKINRLLRWRTIERYLKNVETILEVGGGTGAFSLPLARRGYRIVHVDFSKAMIDAARKKASGIKNLEFLLANAVDLRPFEDRSMDLVLNMDGAISFCGTAAERAIAESCRVARRTLIASVSNRAWLAAVWLSESIKRVGSIIPAVYEMIETGFWHKEQYPENDQFVRDYFGTLKSFLPQELHEAISRNGMKVIELRAIGSLSNLSNEVLLKVLGDENLLNKYVDLCEQYDKSIDPSGPGTRQRAGLLAVAQR